METTALVASCVSIGIAAFAVWLSITFYKMSNRISQDIKEAAKDISSGVDQLKDLFKTLYTDTFGIMRDTVTDMRKHIWPSEKEVKSKAEEETEKRIEEKLEKLRSEMQRQIGVSLAKQKIDSEKVDKLSKDMVVLIQKSIQDSIKAVTEAKEEWIRETVLSCMKTFKIPSRVSSIINTLDSIFKIPGSDVVSELYKLKEEGLIDWEDDIITPMTLVRFKQTKEK